MDDSKSHSHQLLPYENGSYDSVHIRVADIAPVIDEKAAESGGSGDANGNTSKDDPFSNENFPIRLQRTIETCRNFLKKSSIWIHIPMTRASLIETSNLSSLGFRFHHAEDQLAHLYLWLRQDIECKIPTFATHQVGVGAMVLNSRNEILTVYEKQGLSRKFKIRWKMPGGLADLGESIEEAVIREVKEETGISCVFRSILGVRHTHNVQFGRSDLYFVCRLDVAIDDNQRNNIARSSLKDELNTQQQSKKHDPERETDCDKVPIPVPQQCEIESTAWVPLDDYREWVDGNDPSFDGHPLMSFAVRLFEQDHKYDIQRTMMKSVVKMSSSPFYHAPMIMKDKETYRAPDKNSLLKSQL